MVWRGHACIKHGRPGLPRCVRIHKSMGVWDARGVLIDGHLSIGNTTPIAQEHEGMSCLVGGSLDWFLIDGNKDIEVVQV